MGFISAHHAEILHNRSLINLHTLRTGSSLGSSRRRHIRSALIEQRENEASRHFGRFSTDVLPRGRPYASSLSALGPTWRRCPPADDAWRGDRWSAVQCASNHAG